MIIFFQIVVFDQIMTNHGNSYRQSVGVFITPHNGMYQFHMHVHTRKSYIAEVTLRVCITLMNIKQVKSYFRISSGIHYSFMYVY